MLADPNFTNTDFGFGANVFVFWVWIQILCAKSSEVRYYLELKAKRDRVLER